MLIPLIPVTELSEKNKTNVMQASIVHDVVVQLPRAQLIEIDPMIVAWCQTHRRGLTLGSFSLHEIDMALQWLNHGIKRIVLTLNSTISLDLVKASVSRLPAERVILKLGEEEEEDKFLKYAEIFPLVHAVLVKSTSLHHVITPHDNDVHLIVQVPTCSPEQVGDYHKKHIDVLMINMHDQVGACFVACARTDRLDGLFTTVVTDASGVALGLVYSSQESILEAIQSRRGVYYSRSRYEQFRMSPDETHA